MWGKTYISRVSYFFPSRVVLARSSFENESQKILKSNITWGETKVLGKTEQFTTEPPIHKNNW